MWYPSQSNQPGVYERRHGDAMRPSTAGFGQLVSTIILLVSAILLLVSTLLLLVSSIILLVSTVIQGGDGRYGDAMRPSTSGFGAGYGERGATKLDLVWA